MAKSLRRRLRQIDRVRIRSDEERFQQILDERTRTLAARATMGAEPAEALPRALVCGAGRERFGILVETVAEILPLQKCVPVPDGPPALVGLFGRNGRLVSVIDLALALGLEPAASNGEDRHLVLLRREQPQVALRVDRAYAVADVLPLTGEEAAGLHTDAVTGYAKVQTDLSDEDGVVSLLDIERLLRPFLPASPVPGV
jgi:purine-binding chemotaxis protein CheW